jgi:hypothetical protein
MRLIKTLDEHFNEMGDVEWGFPDDLNVIIKCRSFHRSHIVGRKLT